MHPVKVETYHWSEEWKCNCCSHLVVTELTLMCRNLFMQWQGTESWFCGVSHPHFTQNSSTGVLSRDSSWVLPQLSLLLLPINIFLRPVEIAVLLFGLWSLVRIQHSPKYYNKVEVSCSDLLYFFFFLLLFLWYFYGASVSQVNERKKNLPFLVLVNVAERSVY